MQANSPRRVGELSSIQQQTVELDITESNKVMIIRGAMPEMQGSGNTNLYFTPELESSVKESGRSEQLGCPNLQSTQIMPIEELSWYDSASDSE